MTTPEEEMSHAEQAAYNEALRRIEACRKEGKRGTSLDLMNLGLPLLPPEIGKLQALIELYLDGNQLTSLPPEIGQLQALRELYITINELKSLPPHIGQLRALTVLNLSNNRLTSLPPQIGQLQALTNLEIHNNLLASLPPQITQLSGLKQLRLNVNKFSNFPSQVTYLKTLNRLDLDNNQLKNIPPNIGQLQALTGLYLHNNQLTSLPSEIGKLQALKELHLDNNQLTSLPLEIRKVQALTELYLHDNPGLGLPPEILGPTWEQVIHNKLTSASAKAILDYYFDLQKAKARGKTEPLNEAKVLILGQPEAGKSSLIHALTEAYPTPHFDKTDGIARREWTLDVKDGKIATADVRQAEKLRLNLWDFGGQEIYKSTHTFFLTQRAVYVIVTTARQDTTIDADLEEWLETAKTFGGGAPVWIVINKHDENPTGGPDEEALIRKYHPMLRGFIRTQCQHAKAGPHKGTGAGLNIEKLKQTLVDEAWAMPEVRREMSSEALAIKRHLEGMPEPTLTVDRYREICAEFGVDAEGQQDILLGLWDKLGTVRYFPDGRDGDSPALQETAILNPEWVTEAVYKVLGDEKLKKANGLVTEADFSRIMKALKHPAGSHHLISKVMHRFSQLYDAGDGRMFIPQLLEDKEPQLDWPKDALRFIYEYTVLPPGLIPSFIAKMHRYHSTEVCPWRKGCVLNLQGCRVRVIGDKKRKQVEISVADGPAHKRRDALDQVRFKFEELHGPMTAPDELIPVPGYPEAPLLDYRFLRTLENEGETEHRVAKDSNSTASIKISIAEALGGVRGTAMKQREDAQAQIRHYGDIIHGDKIEGNKSMKQQTNNIGGHAQGNNFGDDSSLVNQDSFNQTVTGLHGQEVADLFAKLTDQLKPLKEEMKGKDYRELEGHLETIKAEAQKEEPDKGLLAVSGKGLIEAAKTVKDIAGPVITTAGLILKFLGVPVP